MTENNNEEDDIQPVEMVDVVALVLVTREDNDEFVDIGESFELDELKAEVLIERGIIVYEKDYVPPVEEGEKEEVEEVEEEEQPGPEDNLQELEKEVGILLDPEGEETLSEELELFEGED